MTFLPIDKKFLPIDKIFDPRLPMNIYNLPFAHLTFKWEKNPFQWGEDSVLPIDDIFDTHLLWHTPSYDSLQSNCSLHSSLTHSFTQPSFKLTKSHSHLTHSFLTHSPLTQTYLVTHSQTHELTLNFEHNTPCYVIFSKEVVLIIFWPIYIS